ncbi:MAG TPA: hypothetical protein DF613_08805 [Lachnospiraceae bacterium]|nr:hypothetical protein [Lachnospiraceae bacterium]
MENQRRAETNKKMFCNCCGKEIRTRYGLPEEGVCAVHTDWGYFSDKDGESHEFVLCEKCYDEITSRFVLPVEVKECLELI